MPCDRTLLGEAMAAYYEENSGPPSGEQELWKGEALSP